MNLRFILNFWSFFVLVFLKESLCFNNFRRPNLTHFSGKIFHNSSLYSSRFNLNSSSNEINSVGSKIIRTGVVVDCMPNTNFLVLLDDSNKKLVCSLSGKLYQNKVRIWNNSRVNIEVDLMYPGKGRIIKRLNDS